MIKWLDDFFCWENGMKYRQIMNEIRLKNWLASHSWLSALYLKIVLLFYFPQKSTQLQATLCIQEWGSTSLFLNLPTSPLCSPTKVSRLIFHPFSVFSSLFTSLHVSFCEWSRRTDWWAGFKIKYYFPHSFLSYLNIFLHISKIFLLQKRNIIYKKNGWQ